MQTVGDRVQETSETSGTGTLDLEGAVAGHRTFVAEIGDGNTCHYLIEHRNGSEWELGIGTVTDAPTDTLSRDTVLKSSNGDSKVDLSGGTKDVACTMPSGRAVLTDIKPTFSVDVDLGSNSLLNASIAAPLIDSGELADARLSANVGLLDAAQTYTGAKTFDPGPVVIGTDPGGSELLRVGGGIQVSDDILFAGIGFRDRVESIVMMSVEDLEDELIEVTAGFGSGRRLGVNTNAYSITNDVTDRTFDANATTTAELADIVATLIRDLGRDS